MGGAYDEAGMTEEMTSKLLDTDELVALIAHEVRSPLALVLGYGELLLSRWADLADEDRLDAARTMTEQARHLLQMVDNLLSDRSLERGTTGLRPVAHEPGPLVSRLARQIEPLAEGRAIDVEVQPGLPDVWVEPNAFRQVVVNLVTNAVRHSPPGTPVTMTVRNGGPGTVLVDVADRGPGIPPEDIDRAFSKFVRLDSRGPGLGLGLYVCRSLMAALGGDIEAAPRPGGGLVVTCGLRAVS